MCPPSPEKTRDRILASAQDLLVEGGIASVTTDAIAKRARVSKKTLYRVFGGKDALMTSVLDAFVEANLAEWDRILDGEGTAIARVGRSFAFVAELLERVQTRILDQVERVDPLLWRRVEAARARRFDRLGDLLEEAQAAGDVRGDVDLDVWQYLLTTTVHAAASPWAVARTGRRLADVVGGIRFVYLDGLLTAQGRSRLARGEEAR